ncbi:hypothetical protein F66182_1499 [Fusarium sp. NRRL 66182]|nr:hypothetical protein F66182_1499 [Fusarium sp. NRRL 66182]
MPFCEICQQACPDFAAPDEQQNSNDMWASSDSVIWYVKHRVPLQLSWKSFSTSLDNDCPLCWVFWRHIRSSPLATTENESVERFQTCADKIEYAPNLGRYKIRISLSGLQVGSTTFDFHVWKTTKDYFTDPRQSQMPSRLLDLGEGNSTTWRIFETRERVDYIALSHRWSAHTPQLLSTNRDSFFRGRPDSMLPRDYQDVISICRAIPIRYLWIDSLCIFQNDEGVDFRREAPIMVDIYRHAFLTLSLCWDFANAGIFLKTRPRSFLRAPSNPYIRKLASACPNPGSWSGGYAFVVSLDVHGRDFHANVSDALINRRAWVLQERCLSRRILYLGNEQLYWECSNGPSGLVASESAFGRLTSGDVRPSIPISPSRLSGEAWRKLIQTYTKCHLSFERDRLVAVSGLARSISNNTGCIYFAGIWLEYWATNLFWMPDTTRCPSSGPGSMNPEQAAAEAKHMSTVPSWSWAGFLGSVSMCDVVVPGQSPSSVSIGKSESDEVRYLAMLIKPSAQLPESDWYAPAGRAILKIRCCLIPAKFDKVMNKNLLQQITTPESSVTLYCLQEGELLAESLDCLQFSDQSGRSGGSKLDCRLSRPVDPTLRCFAVPIFLKEYGYEDFHKALFYGLLIQEVSDNQTGEFFRIGTLIEQRCEYYGLSPVISNTIAEQDFGKASALDEEPPTTAQLSFEARLEDYARAQMSQPLQPTTEVQQTILPYANAMTLDQRIQAWLLQIQSASKSIPQTSQVPCPKRRRLNPPTPEASQSGHSMASSGRGLSPAKRRATDTQPGFCDYDDLDTPRAPRRKIRPPRSESGTSLASTQSQSQASEKSGYSSPTKQLRALESHTRGVIPKELSVFYNKPARLEALLDQIDISSAGIGILPTSQRTLMTQLDGAIYGDFKWTRQPILSNLLYSDERDKLGHTPPPETIQWILHEAGRCNSRGCSEADWNVGVHHRVLAAALRPLQGPRRDQFFDFRLSTTASIIAEYHVASASKKVDFCMYIDANHDELAEVLETIQTLRNILPLGMFNHANLSSLCDSPIAVSIETKKTGEGWENARLQMEVWMAAHWQFLRKLLDLRRRAANGLSLMSETAGDLTASSDEAWQLPDFMPGIIIQGHDWHLVITTPDGEKTIFWQKKNLGDTSSSKGIYKTIYNIQLLRKWAQEEYWTWLRELLLGWPRHDGKLVVI